MVTSLTIVQVLLLVALTLLSIQEGWCIKCWDCNSVYNPRCADTFNPSDFDLVDCDQRYLPHYPLQQATMCRKIIQKIEGTVRIIRSCGFVGEVDPRRICYRRAGTFNVNIEYCQCNSGDGCNGAYGLAAPSALTLGAAILVALPYLPLNSISAIFVAIFRNRLLHSQLGTRLS